MIPNRLHERYRLYPATLVLLTLAAYALFTWWTVWRADREMRVDLLQKTKLVAQALEMERINALTGTEADLNRPDYQRITEQITAARALNPKWRWLYLMGRRIDGAVFFYLDSEPSASKDHAFPGQVYEVAPELFRLVFDTGKSAVGGPYEDGWGTWVSALVPFTNPQTGVVTAVLGIDIDARDWRWDVAAKSALPVGLMLVLLIGVASALVAARRIDATPRAILRRLLPPLAAMLIMLMASALALLWGQHRQSSAEDISDHVIGINREFQVDLNNQVAGFSMALLPIAADANVRKALREGDAAPLIGAWQPVYDTLHREMNLTQFSFLGKDRVCLLRVNNPEDHGEQIERFSVLEAERTGKTASGIELGPQGALTLWVVHPVFDGNVLLGYVELGKEITDILQARLTSGLELAVVSPKTLLDRQAWEERMRRLGLQAEWDHLPNSVALYSSQGRLPDAFASWADQVVTGVSVHQETDREIAVDGKAWCVSAVPLQDASGKEIGDLLILLDITAEKVAFAHLIAVAGTSGAVLLTLLMGCLYVLLRRTDAGIRAQQRKLVESEERLSATLRSIGDGVITCDADGNVVSLNVVAETLTGWSGQEAQGRAIGDVFRIVHATTRQDAEIPVARTLREDRIIGLANGTVLVARDGSERQIADSCAPIHSATGNVLGAVLVFRDVTEEYLRREQLRESEESNRLLVEHAVSAIVVHEIVLDAAFRPVDYVFLSANPAFETHTGLRVADVLGRRVTEVLSCTGNAPFIEIYGEVVRTGQSVSFEQYSEPLGRHYFVNAYRLGEGCFATVFTDISARKQAEAESERNAARLKRLVSILQRSSESIQDFLDYALDQAIQLTGSKIGYIYHYHEDRREFVLNTWSKDVMPACAVANSQTCYELDKTGIWGEAVRQRRPIVINDFLAAHPLKKGYPEGHVPLLKFMTVPVFKGTGIVGVVGLANKETDYEEADILQVSLFMEAVWTVTDRMQAEDALRESEARMRIITDSAQDAILMMDSEGLISYWNPAAERILGYTIAESIGRNLHTLIVPPRYHEAHAAAFPTFRKTGLGSAVGKTLDLYARKKDGQEIAVQLSLSAIQIDGGWHSVGLLRDITERKRAEAELQETNRHLEDAIAHANEMTVRAEMANIAKSQFLANMSHEIRTPMNGVIGMTGLLLDTDLNSEQRHYAEIVRSSGESLLALLNDILDFSKIEAGRLEMETLNFDLRALLDDFAVTLALRAHDKGLEFICAVAPDVPACLCGDPGRLRQILTNLAGNAVKFTHHGEVSVRASLVSETDADILIRFSIKDTGIGIPADKQELLFCEFTQADASTTRQYGGTGLGLAISKQLAECMGGEIGLTSEEGLGSEFWFTARLGKQPERELEVSAPVDIDGMHILIVDDNATNREVLMVQFAAWGVRAEETADGPSALQALYLARDAKDPFRAAILDMQMPGMDGAALARAIKADETLKDTRLLLMTSLGQRGDAKQMEEIGFAAYLTKPARQAELFGCLSAVLANTTMPQPSQPIVTRHTIRELRRSVVRILLAEDNITNQQVAMGVLKKFGLRADAVANGVEALKALESLPYDLVLMDVQMPEMDGFEATRQIRNPASGVQNHNIPIIAMTAHALQGDRERCLEAGMNDYVTKPVEPQALAEALDKWLSKETMPTIEVQVPKISEGTASVRAQELEGRVFDKTSMMARLMHDADLARTVLEGFLEDIPRQIEALRGYLKNGDAPGVERQAHTIKGAAANVGGEAVREVAFEMEMAGKAGDLDAVTAHMAGLETQFERLKEAIGREL